MSIEGKYLITKDDKPDISGLELALKPVNPFREEFNLPDPWREFYESELPSLVKKYKERWKKYPEE